MPDSDPSPAGTETTLLLVEDDGALLEALARQLTVSGVRVTAKSSGSEAMVELARHRFDVMVSDIQMPGVSGLKLLRAVREHDLDLPVILITGRPDLRSAAAAVEYGAFQYLIKPIEVERLRALVQQAANVGRLARLERECAAHLGSVTLPVGDRAGLEAALDKALSSVWMAYQPIEHAVTGEIYGREGLLRAQHSLLTQPALVLNAAERLGRLREVGQTVRDLVASDVAEFADQTAMFFVNLHSEDLLDPALYLPDTRFSGIASRVVLELTERGAFEKVTDLAERLQRLRGLGFRIALDDLGTGSAGTGLFKSLDPDFVKLDMSLIRELQRDTSRQSIVCSMVRVCHELGKQLIAEGVETESERSLLREFGCDYLQGYLLGRPQRLCAA